MGAEEGNTMSKWQPISTAPFTGQFVLLFVDNEIVIARWSREPLWWPWNGRNEPAWIGHECGDDWFNQYWGRNEPTHWMPLPAPPK
jgi:hypothetical protein